MDLHSTLAKLTRHPAFKEWHTENPEAFLAHAFVMLDDENKDTWQIGFYTISTQKMVTFVVSPSGIQHTPEQEVLKTEGEIQKFEPQQVTVSVEDALKIAEECKEKNYSAEKPFKQFFIIQTIEGKAAFNITFLSQSFKTVNIKIDAGSGNIIKHSVQSLAEFG